MSKKHKHIAVIVLSVLVFLWVIKAPIWATWISHKVNLPIFIERISLGTSETLIHKLKVVNPWRFKMRTALKAKTAKISYESSDLRTDPVVFEAIEMDQVYISLEFPNEGTNNNNWTVLGKRILKGVNRKSKGVQIHKFILTNITIEIKGHSDLDGVRKIDRIELDNIDSERGFPTQSLIEQVFQESGLAEFIEAVFYPEEQFLRIPFRLFFGPK